METIMYNGKEYSKSELCNDTLKWLELSEQDRMLSSYSPPELIVFEEKSLCIKIQKERLEKICLLLHYVI